MNSNIKHILSSVSLLTVCAIWIWFSRNSFGNQVIGTEIIQAPTKGFLAPDFSLTTITGEEIQLSSLKGRPVIINFWASWCPPCRSEMPLLDKLQQQYQEQNLAILAVNASNQDNIEVVQNFVAQGELSLPILMDVTGKVMNMYNTRVLPSTYFVNSEGIIQNVIIGGMNEATLRIQIEKMLNQQNPQDNE
jgi:thiol-disulfide isomerase/thioredoxin